MDMWPMYMMPPTHILARIVAKSFTVRTVCIDIWSLFKMNVEKMQKQNLFDFIMEEEFYTDYAYIPCLCKLKIKIKK